MGLVRRSIATILIVLGGGAISWLLVSCGGGNKGGGTTKQMTATQQAAASADMAKGSMVMTADIGDMANMAAGYIPPGYAPGKSPSASNTEAIANIDPKLKKIVDKMREQVSRHSVQNTIAKAGTFSKMLSAAASSSTIACADSGTIDVTDTVSSSGTATTHTLSISYNHCREYSYDTSGTISAVRTSDTDSSSTTVTMNLTDTYYAVPYTDVSEIAVLSGTFANQTAGSAGGSSSANGSFGLTMVDPVYGNITMTLAFGSGSPITDTWTLVSGGSTTLTHTANGSFVMTVSASGQSVSLGITLTNLTDTLITTAGGTDESISGSISIGWSPDLSQYGCMNGTYVFTTLAPIHTAGGYCPVSGKLRVNNAVIEYGVPSGYNVKVTLDSGPSEVFADCYSLGGGMCSY